ncbi:hypothetical protein ACFPM7_15455 [Actinokineospora guangxiensis]|uniref:Ig-like domain-containing protein n=1 Tax=Actinokineospora guangxiensis TaxID=1490288 RepID=A0ABW0ENP1_9PSEU
MTSPVTAVAATAQVGGGLQCTVYPYWSYPPVYADSCSSPRPSYNSTVHFKVVSPSPAYTYSWSMSGAPLPSTCTSTSSTCTVPVNNRSVDRYVTATVTVSGVGQFISEAWVLAACPGPTGTEFC